MKYFAQKYACHADDFLAEKNKVVLTEDPSDPLVSMRCFGHATVAKVQPQLVDWCADGRTDESHPEPGHHPLRDIRVVQYRLKDDSVQMRVFSRLDLHGKHRRRLGD